eukprot:Gregarina_sp_Poly_1__10359@NODE_739_length_6515_cov_119_200527_g388_i1_p7_GENE_NODE_739_length_6515_cov_119_200527_g388_i1NODE_739_length_6515_cov_119_200527_g388_i1_p7_ORF_typecomplete_len112_score4_54_NODE_739_length_6515_cov_119_200527_g388_i139294264
MYKFCLFEIFRIQVKFSTWCFGTPHTAMPHPHVNLKHELSPIYRMVELHRATRSAEVTRSPNISILFFLSFLFMGLGDEMGLGGAAGACGMSSSGFLHIIRKPPKNIRQNV